MIFKNKTSTQIQEKQQIEKAKRLRDALSDKPLTAFENNEDMADPDIFEEPPPRYMPIDDEDDMPVEESRAIFALKEKTKNLMLDKHLQKYANPFPIDVFPEPIREHIKDVEKCLNFPQEYYASGILSAVAGAIRNHFQILFKGELVSTAMLYLLIVGKSGINKSTPLARALKPLTDKEIEYDSKFRQVYADYKTQITEGIENQDEPVCSRCLVNDITMEALKDILAENPQGLTLYYDEFMAFLNSMNKYRSGDDMQIWLSIWSAKLMRVDRKNRMGVLIKQPFVNCIGTIQTDVLIKYITSLKDMNGYVDRLLFTTVTIDPPKKWNNLKVNSGLEKQYHKIVRTITDVESSYSTDGELQPTSLAFSLNAFNKILTWQNENTELCKNTNDQQMIGIYNKLELYAIRFTLILTVLDYAHKHPSALSSNKTKIIITEKHVNDAIKITEYFRNSAKGIMGLVSPNITTKHYDPRYRIFYEKLPQHFNTRHALKLGMAQGLSERAVYYYLKSDFVKCVSRGVYEKRYQQK